MAKMYDHLFKMLVIGDPDVGKTSILLSFTGDPLNPGFAPTIGIDFKVKTIEMDGKQIKFQLWDTAGQERYRTITKVYYRSAMGIILVYDITNAKTFENIKKWMISIQDNAPADVDMILLGNKCELEEKRQVSKERGERFAIEHGIRFLETSARTGANLDEAFTSIVKDIIITCEVDMGLELEH